MRSGTWLVRAVLLGSVPVSTMRNVLVIASPEKVSEGKPIEVEVDSFRWSEFENEYIDRADLIRMGRLLVLSCRLPGDAWFLSRAFVLTLFLLGGMVEVVFEMGLQRGMIAPRLPMPKCY